MRIFLFTTIILFSLASASLQALDINAADTEALANTLPGIGPSKAQAIVSYRELHGPFQTPDSLLEVKGIGPVILSRITPLIEFGETTALSPDGLKRQRQEQALRLQLKNLLDLEN